MELSTSTTNIDVLRIIIVSLLVLLVILLAIVGLLIRRIKRITKVRYGFGGKPLFSLLLVLGIAIAIPLTLRASLNTVDYVNMATAEKEIIVNIHEISREEERYEVAFMAVPRINGVSWKDRSYSITWIVEGPISFQKEEDNRSSERPSYFVKELIAGTYNLKVTVKGENFDLTQEESFTLE